MKQDKLLELIARWRELQTAQRDLDAERSRWCQDLRAEFPAGDVGDRAFAKWLDVELGIAAGPAGELLDRARAAAIVPDAKTWSAIGGFRGARHLIGLSKKDQVAVVDQAKAEARAISSVIRERGLGPERPARPNVPDVVVLAEYVVSLDGVPKRVREIAERYARSAKRSA